MLRNTFLIFLLLITIAVVFTQVTDTSVGSTQTQETNNVGEASQAQETNNTGEGEELDAVLSSNGTDVLTTQATFFGNHTQTQKTNVELRVRKSDYEKYQFQPMVIGGNSSDSSETLWSNSIRFMNAQNATYYERTLKKPILILWILISRNPKERFEYSYSLKRFIETAWKMNIQALVVNSHDIDLLASDTGLQRLVYKHQPVEKLPDAILPRMGAKIDYHSLAVVRQFDKMDVLVLNNHNSLEISRDKLHTIQQLAMYNLPIPKTMMAKFPVDTENIAREFDFPVVLKKVSGSQGKGVMLVTDRDHLRSVQEMIDVTQPMIFQQYIANSRGRDIRVIVVGGKVIGAMMRQAGNNDFRSNFHQGGFVESVQISRAVEWLAIEAVRLIDLDVAGVDILIDTNSYRICEINASPGFQGFEMATEVDVPKHIMDFIKLRSGVWGKRAGSEGKKKSTEAVHISVSAEHVLPKQLKAKPQNVMIDINAKQKLV